MLTRCSFLPWERVLAEVTTKLGRRDDRSSKVDVDPLLTDRFTRYTFLDRKKEDNQTWISVTKGDGGGNVCPHTH